jgi:hypothetical protein
MKILIFFFLVLSSLGSRGPDQAFPLDSGHDVWINKVNTRFVVSPDFIKKGGTWDFSKSLGIDREEIVEKCRNYLTGEHKDRNWTYVGLSIHSWNPGGDYWYLSVIFRSDRQDMVSIAVNLKKDLRPIDKSYSEHKGIIKAPVVN